MKNKDHNTGFTLVELMIAVAVISILASIAVPTYRDYTVRAKAGEALNLAASAKISITEYYISEGRLPRTLDEAGLQTLSTDYVSAMEYTGGGDSGQIIMTLASDIGGDAGNKKIVIEAVPNEAGSLIRWSCAPADEDGVVKKYLPANCR